MIEHTTASSMVRNFGLNSHEVADYIEHQTVEDSEIELLWPGEGFKISVRFYYVKNHPEWMRIRSTNWRCENEPNGIYRISEARQFYRSLLRAGFKRSRRTIF
jgi:hypothetical protein